MKEKNIQIIIVPGILGSVLSYSKCTLFPSIDPRYWRRGSWSSRMQNLADDKIEPSSIVPYFYKDLIRNSNFITDQVVEFAYDWRKNNMENIEALRQIIMLSSAEEIVIIAHSMGGILAKLLLSKKDEDPELHRVTKFITLGTPWYGSMDAYKRLIYGFGKVNGFMKETIGKLESIYQLLPHKKYIDLIGENYSAYFLGQRSWDEVYKNIYLDICKENHIDIEKVLDNFYTQCNNPLPDSIEHHEIIGYGYPTKFNLLKQGGTVSSAKGQGDKTVPLDSACSNTKYKYFIKCSHQKLPNNDVVNNIINDILSTDLDYDSIQQKYDLPTYGEVLEEDLNFKLIRVACPVNVALLTESQSIEMLGSQSEEFWDLFFDEDTAVEYFDDSVELIMEKGKESNLMIEAYDCGGVTVCVEEYTKGLLANSNKFKTFNIDPAIVAKLNVRQQIKECNVCVNDGEQIKVIESLLVDNRKDTLVQGDQLPETEVSLEGANVQKVDKDKYVATGDVYLAISNIKKGTYRVLDTLCKVNSNHKMSLSQGRTKIKLEEGTNFIKFYSVDEYNNEERAQLIEIDYYTDDRQRIPKIILTANPDNYKLDVEKCLSNLLTSRIILEDGENPKNLEFLGIPRRFYLTVEDALGQVNSEEYLIDENLLSKLLKSEITKDEFETFINNLHIKEYQYKLVYKTGFSSSKKTKWRTRFNYLNFAEANAIIIGDKNNKGIEVYIDKIREYNIMFSNMSEYVDLSDSEDYQFDFSVFNKDLLLTINDVEFKVGLFLQDQESEHKFEKILSLDSVIMDDMYHFEINTTRLRQELKEKNIDIKEYSDLYINIYDTKDELVASRKLTIK